MSNIQNPQPLTSKTFKADNLFGLKTEKDVLTLLQNNIHNGFKRTKKMSIVDFYLKTTDNKKCIIELKSRNINKSKYSTTLMPLNKYEYMLQKPNYKGIFLFKFTDGLYGCNIEDLRENENFIIDDFKRNKRVDYDDKRKKYLFINNNFLRPYNELIFF